MNGQNCWLCKNDGKSIISLGLGEIIITESVKYTRVGDGRDHSAPLNFCPVCGRKLPGRAAEQQGIYHTPAC